MTRPSVLCVSLVALASVLASCATPPSSAVTTPTAVVAATSALSPTATPVVVPTIAPTLAARPTASFSPTPAPSPARPSDGYFGGWSQGFTEMWGPDNPLLDKRGSWYTDYDSTGDTIFATERVYATTGSWHDRVIRMDRSFNVLWQFLEPGTSLIGPVAYHKKLGRLIVRVSRDSKPYIYELSPADGHKIRTLASTTLGPLGWIDMMEWDPWDDGRFWVNDSTNNVVLCTDFTGDVYWQFGAWGVPGDGDTHLNKPQSFALSRLPWYDTVVIGDTENDRVIWVKYDTKTIDRRLPFGQPWVASHGLGNIVLWGGPYTTSALGMFQLHFNIPIAIAPFFHMGTDSYKPNPADPWKGLTHLHEIEWDKPVTAAEIGPSYTGLWRDVAVDKSVTSRPFVDWWRPKKTLSVVATQNGKLDIQVARLNGQAGQWDGKWESFISQSIKANQLASFVSETPVSVFRAVVTLDAPGAVNGWVNLSP